MVRKAFKLMSDVENRKGLRRISAEGDRGKLIVYTDDKGKMVTEKWVRGGIRG